MSSGGIAAATSQPCTASHPRSRSRSHVSSSSTPSATTSSPRECARSTVHRTISASSVSTASRATNDRSIFSSLTGSRRRCTRDEYPVPKSSRDIFTPCPVSPLRVSAARCGSSRRTCSVISSWSDPAGTPCRASRAATDPANPGVCTSRGETFTATGTNSPWARHLATWARAVSSTYSVRCGISPDDSAIAMNSSGGTFPRSGCTHRTSASSPAT